MSTPSMSVPRSKPLRLAVLPRSTTLVNAALVVGGVLFMALFAQISIPLSWTPVPITGGTFAVAIIGTAYGAYLGGLTLFAYYLAGMAGAPFYAEGNSGWDVATGPTAGYLVGFIFAAFAMGWLAERRWDRRLSSSISLMLCGTVVIYAFGLAWLSYDLGWGLDETLEGGLYPFVIGDVVKLYLAAALVPLAWKGVERLKGRQP
jgi:biotin transport system substrate-specific component